MPNTVSPKVAESDPISTPKYGSIQATSTSDPIRPASRPNSTTPVVAAVNTTIHSATHLAGTSSNPTTSLASTSSTLPAKRNNSATPAAAIGGICVGLILLVAVLFVTFLHFRRRRNKPVMTLPGNEASRAMSESKGDSSQDLRLPPTEFHVPSLSHSSSITHDDHNHIQHGDEDQKMAKARTGRSLDLKAVQDYPPTMYREASIDLANCLPKSLESDGMTIIGFDQAREPCTFSDLRRLDVSQASYEPGSEMPTDRSNMMFVPEFSPSSDERASADMTWPQTVTSHGHMPLSDCPSPTINYAARYSIGIAYLTPLSAVGRVVNGGGEHEDESSSGHTTEESWTEIATEERSQTIESGFESDHTERAGSVTPTARPHNGIAQTRSSMLQINELSLDMTNFMSPSTISFFDRGQSSPGAGTLASLPLPSTQAR